MPKDINPMPPRTFRGGFLFVQINPHPSKAQYRRARRTADFPFPLAIYWNDGCIDNTLLRHLFHVISNECSMS